MEKGCTIKTSTFIGILVVLMLFAQGRAALFYYCWGGCVNECILIDDKKPEEKVPCYWNCLAKCSSQTGLGSLPGLGTTPTSPGKLPAQSGSASKPLPPSPSSSGSASEPLGPTETPALSPMDSDPAPDSSRFGDGTSRISNDAFRARRKKYHCIIGCSLQACLSPTRDGADLKTCLLRCSNKCKALGI